MADRWAQYRAAIEGAARGDGLPPEDLLYFLARDLNDRLFDQEGKVLEIEAIKATILSTVLAYNQDKLAVEFDRLRALTDVGLLFEASSTTTANVAIGELTLVVAEADRGRFTPAGFVGVMKTGDPSVFMAGQRVAYDRASGQLTLDVDRLTGSGTHSAWTILAVSGTDYAAAASEAAASAGEAAVSAIEAAGARAEAQGHADDASAARTLAETARTGAEVAQGAAEDAEDAAATHLAGIQAIATHYLGPAAANPTTKPGGGALAAGDLYWNTGSNEMRVYSGSSWGAAYIPGGSTVSSWNGRTGAVTPASGDYGAALVTNTPAGGIAATTVQAALNELDTEKAPKASPVFTADATVSNGAGAATVTIKANAGQNALYRLFGGAAGADQRWSFGKTTDAESGANAGANFALYRYADNGAYLGAALQINRATGKVLFAAPGSASAGINIGQGTAPSSPVNGDLIPTASGMMWHLAGSTRTAVETTREVNTGTGLTGGGDLSTHRTLAFDATWGDARYSLAAHVHAAVVASGAAGFMTGTDKAKLDGIDAGANAYVHPTGDGNRHVPATSTTNNRKVLTAGATAASEAWDFVAWPDVTGIPAAVLSVAALTPAADRLAYYTDASTAALTPLSAFVRTLLDDADAATARTTLGAAASSHSHADGTTGVAGFLSTADKTKLDGIAAGANNYAHPNGDGNRHVPATSTTNNGKVLKAGAAAASEAWGDVAWAEVASKPNIVQAIAGLTMAADRLPYLTGTGAGSAALATFTAFARSLLDDADAATARTTLGVDSAIDVQAFTTSGTWTKPTGKSADTPVFVYGWGGGGSGARSSGTSQDRSGGGGGCFWWAWLRLGDLASTVPVTIGAGGAARTSNQGGQAGGNSTFGTHLTCFGGQGGTQTGSNSPGGGGGGVRGAASNGTGGKGTGATGDDMFGGGSSVSGSNGGSSWFGGGAGGPADNDRNGGDSEFGGGGGSARSGNAGTSKFGGNGGSSASPDGVAPGGGGAGGAATSGAGARGEIRVVVF